MSVDASAGVDAAAPREAADGSDIRRLRAVAVAAGIGAALAFITVGLTWRLQLYGDGSVFSYAAAATDAWAFHSHNISGRLFVYLFAHVPAEAYVRRSRDATGGIAVYGFLFFAAPLFGLIATWFADRSPQHTVFVFACASTAVLCPLVFGAPTEMWMAHALFWPALALCHDAPRGTAGLLLVLLALLALAFTHEGALVLAAAILITVALRGLKDPALLRAAGAALVVLLVWCAVKTELPPDGYIAGVLRAAAFNFIDVGELARSPLFLLIAAAVAAYALLFALLRLVNPATAAVGAAALVALALAVYWLRFDHALHAEHRYYLRTALLIATPLFGALAAATALFAQDRLRLPVPLLPRLLSRLASAPVARAATGALALVLLVHGVETAKFVAAWRGYEAALRALATGTASDPGLGDARFVSSDRIAPALNRPSWNSTTPYLSVLLAPGLMPERLVVDPHVGYFWLSCPAATAHAAGDGAIPVESRRLLRVYACLHR